MSLLKQTCEKLEFLLQEHFRVHAVNEMQREHESVRLEEGPTDILVEEYLEGGDQEVYTVAVRRTSPEVGVGIQRNFNSVMSNE